MADHYAFARLTHNSNGWIKPSGWAHKAPVGSSAFEAKCGFGFEEWLFNPDYSIEGWQYGYVESIRSTHSGYPLALYTFKYSANRIGPAERILVAIINEWKHVDNASIGDHIAGWRNTMIEDVVNVLGDDRPERQSTMQINLHAQYPQGYNKPPKNVCFKYDNNNVRCLYDTGIDISPIIRTGRFIIQTKSKADIPPYILNVLM